MTVGRQFAMRSASGPENERAVMVRALTGLTTLRNVTQIEKRKAGAWSSGS